MLTYLSSRCRADLTKRIVVSGSGYSHWSKRCLYRLWRGASLVLLALFLMVEPGSLQHQSLLMCVLFTLGAWWIISASICYKALQEPAYKNRVFPQKTVQQNLIKTRLKL
jgi:hypothetical protein